MRGGRRRRGPAVRGHGLQQWPPPVMGPGASNVRCSPIRSRFLPSESKEASRKGRAESVIWQQSGEGGRVFLITPVFLEGMQWT